MKNKISPYLDNFYISINTQILIDFNGISYSDDYNVFIDVDVKDKEENITAASLTIGVVYNNNGRRSFDATMDKIDGFDGSFYNCLEALRYNEEDFAISNKELHKDVVDHICDGCNIFYVDKVYVAPKFRKKGLAKALLSYLPRIIDEAVGCYGGIVLLAARPQEIENDESVAFKEAQKALYNLYEKSGFTRIEDNVFVLQLDY